MDEQLDRLAPLDEPTRRRVYEHVRAAGRPVSREEVADALELSRKAATFHLERLREHALLTAHYARPAGRGGPGAGRSAKFYEAAPVEIDVTIPPRRYGLAAELLLRAISTERPGERAAATALRVAAKEGRALGADAARRRRLRSPAAPRTLAVATEVLRDLGFEPYSPDRSTVALRNCPFHALAQGAPELMCGMNRAFLEGIVRGLGSDRVRADLACTPGDCCVTLRAPAGRPATRR